MRHGEGLRRDPRSSKLPTPRFTRKYETWNLLYHTGGTCSQTCMMEAPRYTISELHFGKFTDSGDFQCWVDMARSIDDLLTSQSSEGDRDFPDFVQGTI